MCGIIGIVSGAENPVAPLIYDGLTVLQHRGQDAAGIVTCQGEQLYHRKSNGLVRDVFQQHHMESLGGHMGVGHVRYPTAGTSSCAEAQPFYTNSPYGITLAHNGNLTNANELSKQLYNEDLRHVNTSSDSEVLMNIFAHELLKRGKMYIENELRLNVDDVFHAISRVHNRCRGGYSIISMITGYGLVGFRDPWGIRPLILGQRKNSNGMDEWILASESVAIISLGFEIVRDIAPGEAVFITAGGEFYEKQCAEDPTYTPCIFEYVYFARPDSVIDGISVHRARLNMGRKLAQRILQENPKHGIDVVIPIPDSGRSAALELARELGVDFREGFVKNRYVGRTFIMPGQEIRKDSVRKKLNPIPDEFFGKNVLLVDDSIVRGNTSRKIVQMARDVGAKKVFFASAAPPVIHPNVYGIDMPAKSEYIAHDKSIEDIAIAIGADWLMYQKLEDLIDACQGGDCGVEEFDTSCFNGVYVTKDIDYAYLKALEEKRNDNAKSNSKKNDEVLEIHNEP
ncbi:MAG: amidophosphoribosyltransferase [Candidatus Thalassarchaeaceae archaeon]|jgi:amidophosphoribosyltransferase|nr:amidophosphoribosyltransferase [Candidatus Thalassarchaeaceae archaeon]